jgi:hypothetical protein
MSWQDATIAIAGALLVVGLGSALIREILRTAQLVLAVNGQIRLEDQYRKSKAESTAARQRQAVKSKLVREQVEILTMKNGEHA